MIAPMSQAPWLSPLANHLWQSTLLVAAAWLLTFALRHNQARIRYWIWLVASLKFLLPFSLLTAAGQRVASTLARPVARPALSHAMDQMNQIAQPFQLLSTTINSAPIVVADNTNLIRFILLSLWAIGSLTLVSSWLRSWVRIRAAVRAASFRTLETDVPVLSSSSLLEPGVFGIVHPVLLLPEGIANRLTQAQFEAILAHEMCHIRRRDNLTFTLHMAVETIFWFHPLVWWLRTRLIEERERACDEAVLQSGSEAETYAEGILNVCKFYIESPLACVSGVTGSDLKQRIVRIMTERLVDNLSLGRRVLLASIGLAVIALPVVFGLLRSPQVRAQEAASALPSFEVATIKPYKPDGDDKHMLFMSPGKFSVTGLPLRDLIRFAYDLKADAQLTGGPAWIEKDRFDIEAKESPADVQAQSKLPPSQLGPLSRLMVQSLLAERFNLKVSHETRELPVYALVIAKNGPKLTPTTAPPVAPPGDRPPGEPNPHNRGIMMKGNGDLTGSGTSISLLADVLSRQQELGNRLVLDKTGLTGDYDWTLKWTPTSMSPASGADVTPPPAGDSSAPSLFTAIQEQLGLKLEPQKGKVAVVVIDHIDPPSAN